MILIRDSHPVAWVALKASPLLPRPVILEVALTICNSHWSLILSSGSLFPFCFGKRNSNE